MTHLSMLEIAAEVDRLVDPSSFDEDSHASVIAHLSECATCRDRVRALHEQDMQVGKALEELQAKASSEYDQIDVEAMADSMMNRLRAERAAERAAKERPREGRTRGATIGMLSFAAGIGFALAMPAVRGTFTTPDTGAVAIVRGQEMIRDSVSGFAEKEYIQKVGVGSAVHLVVQGINHADFDCELYNPKQSKRLAVDDGVGNSCQFSIPSSATGEYRLVVKNKMGAPTSYTMVAQVVSKGQVSAAPSIEVEPLHQVQ